MTILTPCKNAALTFLLPHFEHILVLKTTSFLGLESYPDSIYTYDQYIGEVPK